MSSNFSVSLVSFLTTPPTFKTSSKPFSEQLDFVDRKRKYTNRLATEVVKLLRHSDVHNVAQHHGLSDEEVWSMVEHISKKNQNQPQSIETFRY